MRVAVRVDSSTALGIGHLMRCLSLAQELKRHATEIRFCVADLPGHAGHLVEQAGFRIEYLPHPRVPWTDAPREWDWEGDAAETLRQLGEQRFDWLIVDHYGVDQRWERRMRGMAQRILVVDDLADRQHDCDVLLDQNFYPAMERRYEDLVPATCRQFLGPSYALLREEFRQLRLRLRARSGEIRRVLVLFGGGDPTNETGKAVEGLRQAEIAGLAADVVIGSSSPHAERIRAQCAGLGWVKVHEDIREVATLMGQADLSIGAGGTTSWERCMLGLPAVTLAIAENQVAVLKALSSIRAVRHLGWHAAVTASDIASAVRELAARPAEVRKMGEASSRLVGSGDGAQELARVMVSASSPAALEAK